MFISLLRTGLFLSLLLFLIGGIPPTDGFSAELPDSYYQIRDCPDQEGCPAMILIDTTSLNNDLKMSQYRRHQVIKYFTQDGIQNYSDVIVSTSVGGYRVKNITGRTILPDGTEIPLEQEHIQTKKLKRGRTKQLVRTASFPGLVPGAMVEWSVNLQLDIHSFIINDEWEIQRHLPVMQSTYTLKQGKYELGWWQGGLEEIEIEQTQPAKNTHRFTARNIPALPDETYGPYDRAWQARMYFAMPELQETWLGSESGRISGFTGRFSTTTPLLAKTVEDLIDPTESKLVIARKLYRYIQEKIGTEEQRLEETDAASLDPAGTADEVLSRGWGNEQDRTLLFLAMAKQAGLETAVILIVSRYNGLLDLDIPDRNQFDSYAAALKIGSGWSFYDPATPNCPFGNLAPEKEMGAANGVLVRPDPEAGKRYMAKVQKFEIPVYTPSGFTVVNVPFSNGAKNIFTREAKVRVSADGSAEVEMAEYGTGLAEFDQRESFRNLDDQERLELLELRLQAFLPGAELLEAHFEKINSYEKGARIEYRIRIPEIGSRVGNRFLLSPSLFHADRSNPFVEEMRKTPIQFPFPGRTVERIEFELPEDFSIQEIPAPQTVSETPFDLKTSSLRTGKGFKFTRRMSIDTAQWPVEEYPRLRTFYEKTQKTDRQTVVLTAVTNE